MSPANSSDGTHYAISRLRSPGGFGYWSVAFRRRGKAYSKSFYDVRRGGPEQSLAAAIAWRDKQLARLEVLGKLEFCQLRRTNNTSGIPGVQFMTSDKALQLLADPEVKARYDAWGEGSLAKTALHGMVGLIEAKVAGGNGAAGALGGMAHEALVPMMKEYLNSLGFDESTPESKKEFDGLMNAGSALLGAAVGTLATGNIQGAATGATAAWTADVYNRQLHPKEVALIKQLAKEKAAQTCGGDAQCEAKATVYWTDVLERVGEMLVDDKASADSRQYITTLAQIAANPATEGGMGGVQRYFDDLVDARSMLTPYIGQTITVNGQVAMADGAQQTYFSATDAQKADSTANSFAGDTLWSIIPGGAQRDIARIETLAALNGSAQPVYPLEEAVLGTMAANRVLSLLKSGWTALEIGLAGRVGVSASGNISTQQITREGMAATLNAVERQNLSKLGTLTSTSEQGALREEVTNAYFARNGFTQLESKCGSNNCFDGVFVKGDTVYIVETKPLQVNGAIKLDSSTGYVQLDKDWIEYSASRLIATGDTAKQQTAALIQKALDPASNVKLVKIVAGVNENGVTLVKLAK